MKKRKSSTTLCGKRSQIAAENNPLLQKTLIRAKIINLSRRIVDLVDSAQISIPRNSEERLSVEPMKPRRQRMLWLSDLKGKLQNSVPNLNSGRKNSRPSKRR